MGTEEDLSLFRTIVVTVFIGIAFTIAMLMLWEGLAL